MEESICCHLNVSYQSRISVKKSLHVRVFGALVAWHVESDDVKVGEVLAALFEFPDKVRELQNRVVHAYVLV